MSPRTNPAEHPAPAAPGPCEPVGGGETGLGADVVTLPGELALLLRVALPLASARQRRAAVGYAVEDLIAEPLEASHVVLGPELAPGEFLAVVVRHRDMAEWAARTGDGRRLVPDMLALPVPAEGACSVREADGRLLVRRTDGTGYVAHAESFGRFWHADGAPQIVLYGGRLPEGLTASASGLMPAAPASALARFDLRQGAYARSRAGSRRLIARLGAVAALAMAAHGAIFAVETAALERIARDREATLRAALAERLPEMPVSLPLDVALARALPLATATGGGFLPLLAQVSDTLAPMADEISIRSLAYDTTGGGLSLRIEAADLATLQRVEADLGAAGLSVAVGAATTGDGAAEAQYVITGAGS